MYCFGVTHHNPSQVVAFLGKNKLIEKRSNICYADNDLLPSEPPRKIIFILDAQTATRNLRTLNSDPYAEAMVFVFASTLRLSDLSGCILIDSTPSVDPLIPVTGELPLRMKTLRQAMRKPCEVRKTATDHLKFMVDHVKRGSLLNPLMSFIYSLPSSTHQTPVKDACALFYRTGTTIESLLADITRRLGTALNKNALIRFRAIIDSDDSKKYRTLFKEFKQNTTDAELEALCVKHAASPYEVRYLLSVFGDATAKNNNASRQKHGNRRQQEGAAR